MLLRPTNEDLSIIGHYLGKIISGISGTFLIPIIIALIFEEWNPLFDFLLCALLGSILGFLLQQLFSSKKDLNWSQGLAVASLSWLIAMFLGAVPLYLSGHFASYLDACFDAMSGFATTGLTLIQNGDHLAHSLNMWRHLMMFLGGQGIVVIALTFLIRGTAGAYRLYVGEAREERVLPNVIQTARFIWLISFVYLALGSLALTLVGFSEGMSLTRSFLHSIWVFMAAFDTGGFAPQSQNILYYHSFPYELVTVAFMILGMLNFSLHYVLWQGNFKEFFKNIETRTLFSTIFLTFFITAVSLFQLQTYPNGMAILRKGFYHLISGHSGTGYMTIYAPQFPNEWSILSLFALTLAMGLGGSACSTAGGIKALRIGIFFKALLEDIRRILSPGSAIIVSKFHHLKEVVLEEKLVRSSLIILLAYLITYLLGAMIGTAYGYPWDKSFFESVSAAANVGLSTGIATPSMPAGLKITYIVEMWIGRLEFMSILILFGLAWARIAGAKGR